MSYSSSEPPSFRTDINGLRAWAVAAVVLYHFRVPGFSGGFAGVDVFFVISGFLMTGIVVRGLERGDFSILDFYRARARRILPALMLVCIALLAMGWWLLPAPDYKTLGTHVLYSVAFISNVRFRRESGYFDSASDEKWLLHTWSLSVEWQFYLLLPLVLLGLWKWRPERISLAWTLAVGLASSLVYSILSTGAQPTAAFYLLPSRAWEMLAGGLVYLLGTRVTLTEYQRNALVAGGMILVISAWIGFDASSPWPGWRALVPVCGCAAVLLAARPGSAWTSHALAQWIGTRSYSIYLWHWPIVVGLTYLELQTAPHAIGAGLVLTHVLGHLSYVFVESPVRVHLSRPELRWGSAMLLAAAIAVAIQGHWIRSSDGIAQRHPASIQQLLRESDHAKPSRQECVAKGAESPACMYGGHRLKAILIGDSHAGAVTTALAAAVSSPEDGIMNLSYPACPTILGVKKPLPSAPGGNCGEFMDWALRKLNTLPKDVPLVIVNRTTLYAKGFSEPWIRDAHTPLVYFSKPYKTPEPAFLSEFSRRLTETACLLAKDRPVYLMRPIPEMRVDVPHALARARLWGRDKEVSISLSDYHIRHSLVWAAQDAARERCGVQILDPLPFLCWDGRCHGTRNGRPLYYDDDHLNEFGSKLLLPLFAEIFRRRDISVDH